MARSPNNNRRAIFSAATASFEVIAFPLLLPFRAYAANDDEYHCTGLSPYRLCS